MVGFKQTLCALLLTTFTGVAIAQNNTNSPYTRYGYGELSDQNFGNSKAMGGIAYGLRDGSQINPLNPASYTAIDSLTFLFEGGVTLQNTNMSGLVMQNNIPTRMKMNAKNSSFDYIAMQFRMRKWLAMSIGLLPYSSVGYNVSQVTQASGDQAYNQKLFFGDGGLHQLYGGFGAKVLENLSVGVNVSYFWGQIQRDARVYYPDASSKYAYSQVVNTSIRDYKLDFGLQYTQQFNKKHSVTLGAVFSPKRRSLNNETSVITGLLEQSTGNEAYVSASQIDSVATFGTPNSFGAGLTYNYDKRLIIGVDYSLQKWSDVTYMNQANAFCDRTKVSVGAEYIPSAAGHSYLSHVKYRLGGYYSTPYYKINGERASREYGITAGFGLPVPRSRSIISVTAQYVRVDGLQTQMLDENILKVSIGFTFSERWFFKRKVD